MRKTLTYTILAIASLLMIGLFVTATTYLQLAISVVLYPLLAYFAYRILPRRTRKPFLTAQPAQQTAAEDAPIANIDKRAFLKLVGASGVALFLYSIFLKKSIAPFFTNAEPASGTVTLKDGTDRKIDPAERQPTDGYRIAEIDDSIIAYFGFTNKGGAWFIMREDSNTGSFRYSRGEINFTAGWAGRKLLKYDYFNNVF